MPRTTILLWLSIATACVSSTEESSSGLALPASLTADARFVARRSLALGAQPRTLAAVPFSHRSRKWHVYPVTAYGRSRFSVQVTVNDSRMARSTGLWVLGPRRDDGTYPT